MQSKKEHWEVAEIDLNLKHYAGHPTGVIKKIKSDIEKYLKQPGIPFEKVQIYSAIYHALEYYKDISYIPSAEFTTDDTFLSSTINMLNDDLEYLSSKYNSPDPTKHKVISLSARIKSPVSFMEKVKEKISEYLEQGRDLAYFNESLRDLIGARIIVDPPDEIQAQGPEAETKFLYQVFYDLMAHRGINEQNQETLAEGHFRFIDVNTRHDQTKLRKIQERPTKKGFSDKLDLSQLFIPTERIPELEQPHISQKIKDYVMYPKFSGYQSLHVCATPDFSDYAERSSVPNFVLPSLAQDYSLEYQFRTKKQNDFAEYGLASHKETYKPQQFNYHRLSVPFYIDIDNPVDLPDEKIGGRIRRPTYQRTTEPRIKLRNFGESYRIFYGHSFQDRFNISFKDFRDLFGFDERNEVLAGKKIIIYNAENNTYSTAILPKIIPIRSEDQLRLAQALKSASRAELINLLDEFGISDSCINAETTQSVEEIYRNANIRLLPIVPAEKVVLEQKRQEILTSSPSNLQDQSNAEIQIQNPSADTQRIDSQDDSSAQKEDPRFD